MIRPQAICAGIVLGILGGITINAYNLTHPETFQSEFVYVAEAEEPRVVQIDTVIDWTPARIEREIREAFPEAPNTAVAIAKCESGLDPDIQSRHILSYGQERSFGIFQVHEPDWKETAIKLDLPNWKTDPKENITLARHIYESAGKTFKPWSCLRVI